MGGESVFLVRRKIDASARPALLIQLFQQIVIQPSVVFESISDEILIAQMRCYLGEYRLQMAVQS